MRFCGAIGAVSFIVGIEACHCNISLMPQRPYARCLCNTTCHTMPQGSMMVTGLHARLLASIWSRKHRPDRTNNRHYEHRRCKGQQGQSGLAFHMRRQLQYQNDIWLDYLRPSLPDCLIVFGFPILVIPDTAAGAFTLCFCTSNIRSSII